MIKGTITNFVAKFARMEQCDRRACGNKKGNARGLGGVRKSRRYVWKGTNVTSWSAHIVKEKLKFQPSNKMETLKKYKLRKIKI
ncbi:hypothetical protein RIF29_29295 [Crotalaria pallida]|uniref:Uncharacterized protein n=1 Tax=Crotalaria pallida TaxID=3830 RepID=A0AAN9EJI4_CROPI